jgi:hypothetical protein
MHSAVYGGHVCGKTTPCGCAARGRSAPPAQPGLGLRACNRTYTATHICIDAGLHDLPSRRPSPHAAPRVHRLRGVLTAYESRDDVRRGSLEVGPGTSGKTQYCATCERGAGRNPSTATRMCEQVRQRAAGLARGSAFYPSCGLDQGLTHKHGLTVWCLKCKAEKVDPHTVHTPQ